MRQEIDMSCYEPEPIPIWRQLADMVAARGYDMSGIDIAESKGVLSRGLEKRFDVGLHAAVGHPVKRWPHWDKLASALELRGYSILQTDIDGQRIALADARIERGWDNLMNGVEQCRLIVSGDTVTTHLAYYLGVPCVTIMGESFPKEGIEYPGQTIIRSESKCPYAPCGVTVHRKYTRRDCPGGCVNVPVESVLTKIMEASDESA